MWKRGAHLYDVGDVVTIADIKHYHENVNEKMESYAGKKATIKRLNGKKRYRIDIDGGEWAWEDFMFELPDEDKLFKKFIKGEIDEDYYKELVNNKKNNVGPPRRGTPTLDVGLYA